MDPTHTLPPHSADNLVNSIRQITNRVHIEEPRPVVSFPNSPPQMMSPRLNPADALRGISHLHSRLDEMLKISSKTQSGESALNSEGHVLSNNITRPVSIQPSYRSEVLEKFSQMPVNMSGFPVSPKLEAFPPSVNNSQFPPSYAYMDQGPRTVSVPNEQIYSSSVLPNSHGYDRNKLDHILANIKSRGPSQPFSPNQIPVESPAGFQGHHQQFVAPGMKPYSRPQELVVPPYNQYAPMPNMSPTLASPVHGFPQSIPPQHEHSNFYNPAMMQPNQYEHANYYNPAMMQPNQVQSPQHITQGIPVQYASNSPYQYPQVDYMRPPHVDPRGHPQFDPRVYEQTPQVQLMQSQVYRQRIPEEFGELEADVEEECEMQVRPKRQGGSNMTGSKRKMPAREEQRQDGVFWGRFQNDEDSLIMTQAPRQEDDFGVLEDDSYRSREMKPKPQPKQKPKKTERTRRRGARPEEPAQRIIPQEIFTENVVEQGPHVEGKVSRPRRNSRKRFPLFKSDEPTQHNTNAGELVDTPKEPTVIFGQETSKGANVARRGSPEKTARSPRAVETSEFQLKEKSPVRTTRVLAELERELELEASGSSEVKRRNQNVLNDYETSSGFVLKPRDRDDDQDSITKAFEYAKQQSPAKRSPEKKTGRDCVAKKTEMVFKSKDSRRKVMK